MVKTFQIIGVFFIITILSGCANKEQLISPLMKADVNISKNPAFNEKAINQLNVLRKKEEAAKRKLPSFNIKENGYSKLSILSNQTVTLSAKGVKLGDILYTISHTLHLNLIVNKDVDVKTPITLSVSNANLEDTLNMIMDISGCYYVIKGNILYVKQYMQKDFFIPYVHTTSSFKTDLGGDTLGSATAGQGSAGTIKGNFKLNFDNKAENNNFYNSLENNIKELVGKKGHYSLNKFSGILTVYDTKKNIKVISDFIKKVKEQTSKTVLIETKILEVTLNKTHKLGINWNSISKLAGNSLQLTQNLALTGATAGTAIFKSPTADFTTMINALDSSGTVDTLSNPRIKVLSGQSAIISSGKLVPFWEKEVQTDQGTGGSASNTQVTYKRRDVLNGVTMGVTPTVMKDGKIMLNVIPITSHIAKIIQHYDEKGKSVASAPVLDIKEAGTIIHAKDGDLVLIGGLISNVTKKETSSIPLLGSIPGLGAMFTQTNNVVEKKELVILIKLKVMK